jgi:hypothetical protein
MWFIFCLAAVMQTFLYNLPLWLQAVEDKSAVQSGIDTLPFVGGFTCASILGSQTIHQVGYYTSSCVTPIGARLFWLSKSRVEDDEGISRAKSQAWIGSNGRERLRMNYCAS